MCLPVAGGGTETRTHATTDQPAHDLNNSHRRLPLATWRDISLFFSGTKPNKLCVLMPLYNRDIMFFSFQT